MTFAFFVLENSLKSNHPFQSLRMTFVKVKQLSEIVLLTGYSENFYSQNQRLSQRISLSGFFSFRERSMHLKISLMICIVQMIIVGIVLHLSTYFYCLSLVQLNVPIYQNYRIRSPGAASRELTLQRKNQLSAMPPIKSQTASSHLTGPSNGSPFSRFLS